jgi:hypothetical protein
MCGLCGAFGGSDHWTGGSAATATGLTPAAERQARARIANQILKPYGLTLDEWAGRFTLRARNGKTAIIDHFGAIWPEAEKLTGRTFDPLDPAALDRMEGISR